MTGVNFQLPIPNFQNHALHVGRRRLGIDVEHSYEQFISTIARF
jgi:hypothetical protein